MISDYIVPLFDKPDLSSFIGTAFCINNFLITAGHVVPDYRIYFTKDSKRFFKIYPDNWIVRQHPTKNNPEHDIAICRLEKLKSELLLSMSPAYDSEADIICWQKYGNSLIKVNTKGLICEHPENPEFYEIITIDRITHGSSGCPILQGNKVVGILTSGVDNPNFDASIYPGASQDQISQFLRNRENTCIILRPEHIKRMLDSTIMI